MTRLRACVALLAVLLGTLTVATGSPASAATGKPKVGQCHNLTWNQAYSASDTRPVVSCRARHTTETIAVKTAPVSLAGLSDAELSDVMEKICTPVFLARLGRTPARRASTPYSFQMYGPTPAQVAQGAQWVRCDVYLRGGKNTMLRLPGHRLPRIILPARPTDATLRCLDASNVPTPCTHRHSYRPNGVLLFKASLPYPKDPTATFNAAASRSCPRSTARWTWVAPIRWSAGDRSMVCYDKTTK